MQQRSAWAMTVADSDGRPLLRTDNPKPDSLHMTGYRVLVYHNGNSAQPHNTFDLSPFAIRAGGTFLICHSHAKIPGARGPEGLRSAKGW